MAKLKLVSIFDSAIQAYMPVQSVTAIGGFVRAVSDVVNSGDVVNQPLAAHPDDYSVFEIGEFDDQTGAIEPCAPVMVQRCKDLLRPKN